MRLRSKDPTYEVQQNGLQQDAFVKDGRDSDMKGSEIKNDRSSILLLVFLYILQGIPLGLAGSMPMVLQNTGISYKQQAVFSLVFWPFSLKLLWAPIVDSVYIKSLGRRKTWLVPTQYLIGIFMLILSMVRIWCFHIFDQAYNTPTNISIELVCLHFMQTLTILWYKMRECTDDWLY